MSTGALVPVLNPDTGDVHAIPTEQVDSARAAGGKPVATMLDPQGNKRYVSMDQVGEAQKNGGKLVPYGSEDDDATSIPSRINQYWRSLTNPVGEGLQSATSPLGAAEQVGGQAIKGAAALPGMLLHPIDTLSKISPWLSEGGENENWKAVKDAGSGLVNGNPLPAENLAGQTIGAAEGARAGAAAAGKVIPPIASAVGSRLPGSRFQFRPQSSPAVVSPEESAARDLTNAINPETKRAPAYIKAAQGEVPNILDFARRNNNPLNTQLEFSKAAEGNAQESSAHYNDQVLGPNASHREVVPENSGVRKYQPSGENPPPPTANLKDINKRIIDINKELNKPRLNAGDQRTALASEADLQAEHAELTNILHRSLSNLTGIAPEEIANLRQRVGRSREIANDTNAAVTGRGLAENAPGGQRGASLPHSLGDLAVKGVNAAKGGPTAIGDRAFQKAIQNYPGQATPLPQVRTLVPPPPVVAAPINRAAAAIAQRARAQAATGIGDMHETDTFDGKTSAGAQVPSEVTALLHRTGAKITNNEAPTSQSVASVSPDDPNTINIDDKERFDKDKNAANQTLSHEAVHIWHNNLPPEIQKMIPMDDPKDPYHGDGYEPDELKQMRSLGVKLWNLPKERAATIIQKYAHMGGDNAPKEIKEAYGPWAKDLVDSPLSTVEQTSADQPGINTAVRPPAPMQEMKIFGEGEGKPEKEDTPNGKREVLHGSKDREDLVEEAKAEAPHLEKGLKVVADQNKGAKFDAVRGEKSEGRLTEKIKREGQPVETVPDVLAGRIAVDSDEAKDAVVADLKKHATVVREKDEFKSGDSRFGFHAHKLQVKVSPKLSAEVQVVPKETAAQDDKQHPIYKQARTAELDGDTGKAKELASKAKEMNDGAKSRFDLRNKEKEKDESLRGSDRNKADGKSDNPDVKPKKLGSGDISGRGESVDGGRGSGTSRDQPSDKAVSRGGKDDDISREHPDGGVSGDKSHKVGDRVTLPNGKSATVAYAPSKSSQLPTYRFKDEDGKTVEMRARDAESKVKKAPDDVSGTVLVDLDQTLAHKRAGGHYIGTPEPGMVERIKKDLAAGKKVEIFTASVAEDPTGEQRRAIQAWSKKHLGVALDVTDKKMPGTGEILDDKAKQVKNGKVMA